MTSALDGLGIEIPRGARGEVRSVCARCSLGRKKSGQRCLAINATLGVWLCHHCGFSGRLRGYEPERRPTTSATPTRADAIRRIWEGAAPLGLKGAAPLYLRGRGFYCRFDDEHSQVLRYHSHLEYRSEDGSESFHPALVALFEDVDGCVTGLLRIYITLFGTKAKVESPKRMLAAFTGALSGLAVQLYPPSNGELAIAEGVETALAVRMLSGIPVWAAGSASQLEHVILPQAVRTVHICPDADDAGMRAAKRLARRLITEDRHVRMAIPPAGTDWADVSRLEVMSAK